MKKLYILNLILAVILLTACVSTTATADGSKVLDDTKVFAIYPQTSNFSPNVLVVVDNETGVNYVVIQSANGGLTVTPRLTVDTRGVSGIYISE